MRLTGGDQTATMLHVTALTSANYLVASLRDGLPDMQSLFYFCLFYNLLTPVFGAAVPLVTEPCASRRYKQLHLGY